MPSRPPLPTAPPDDPRGRQGGPQPVLVGPDAYLFDALARLMPTRYFDVLAFLDGLEARRA